jgi:predicted HTH domain antitoxin
MQAVDLELPDEMVAIIRREGEPLTAAVQELIYLELYRRGSISSGKAAELLGMGRIDFIQYASRLGIPLFDMTPDEWAAEMESIRQR